jgi:hypothetical protein
MTKAEAALNRARNKAGIREYKRAEKIFKKLKKLQKRGKKVSFDF